MTAKLKEDIFIPIAKRVKERLESLKAVEKFSSSGIEGWLKVEAVVALEGKVEAVQNKGPDLKLKDDTKLELKAATDLNPSWFLPGLKYYCPCIFLGCARDPKKIKSMKDRLGDKLIGYEELGGEKGTWVIGIIQP